MDIDTIANAGNTGMYLRCNKELPVHPKIEGVLNWMAKSQRSKSETNCININQQKITKYPIDK